jgi:cobalamin-dependent methionine synthase I
MTGTPAVSSAAPQSVGGRIIEAQVKVSVDATRPLPLVCALYAVESSQGVWLCAYYGANRSVFDFLPQKDADVEERKLGIAFRTKRFIPKDQYQSEQWEEFKKENFMAYGGHGD